MRSRRTRGRRRTRCPTRGDSRCASHRGEPGEGSEKGRRPRGEDVDAERGNTRGMVDQQLGGGAGALDESHDRRALRGASRDGERDLAAARDAFQFGAAAGGGAHGGGGGGAWGGDAGDERGEGGGGCG